MDQEITGNLSSLSQDEIKILVAILDSIHFLPFECRWIIPIIDKLKTLDKQPTMPVPVVIITPENINIKIEHTKK